MILAIETSQREGGVAIGDAGGELLGVELLSAHARHDDALMPAVERLFDHAGRSPRELKAVGVSIGPGGFTGLRIAVSAAKMLALGLGVEIAAVPSSLVAAAGSVGPGAGDGPFLVTLAAKRGTFWATRVIRRDRAWRVEGEPGLVDAATAPWAGVAAVIGDEHLPEAARARCAAGGLAIVEPRFDPARCLEIARVFLAERRVTPPIELAPIYPRVPEATRVWEARRGAAPPGGA